MTRTILSVLIFIFLIFLSGFIMKFLLFSNSIELTEYLDPKDIAAFSYLAINVEHFALGTIFTGILGLCSIFLVPWTGTFIPNFTIRRENGKLGPFFVVLIVVGLAKSLWSIYKFVRWVSEKSLSVVEDAVLDVKDGEEDVKE